MLAQRQITVVDSFLEISDHRVENVRIECLYLVGDVEFECVDCFWVIGIRFVFKIPPQKIIRASDHTNGAASLWDPCLKLSDLQTSIPVGPVSPSPYGWWRHPAGSAL